MKPVFVLLLPIFIFGCSLGSLDKDETADYSRYREGLPIASAFMDNYLQPNTVFLVETRYGALDQGETWASTTSTPSFVELLEHRDFQVKVVDPNGDKFEVFNVFKFRVLMTGTDTLTLKVFRSPNYLTSDYRLIVQ